MLADYFFQTNKWIESRNNHGLKSRFFLLHIGIVFLTSWLLSFQWQFITGAVIITLIHTTLDILKTRLERIGTLRRYLFFADQILHLVTILIVVYWYSNAFEPMLWLCALSLSAKQLFIVAAYLFCIKPTNILLREIFSFNDIRMPDNNEESHQNLPNAGQLIGTMERTLALTFILLGHFEAVGLLIAAKSILRFGEKDHLRSEYVVTGTLLSFGIAIMIGIVLHLL